MSNGKTLSPSLCFAGGEPVTWHGNVRQPLQKFIGQVEWDDERSRRISYKLLPQRERGRNENPKTSSL